MMLIYKDRKSTNLILVSTVGLSGFSNNIAINASLYSLATFFESFFLEETCKIKIQGLAEKKLTI